MSDFLKIYNKEKIESFTQYWWEKSLLKEKRAIIEAGIKAYLTCTDDGYINCIKNLFSEIEGIFRLSYYDEKGKNPNFKDLKEYIKVKAYNAFKVEGSLGFPDIFYNYADVFLFRNFKLASGNVELSRHSVSHGVADSDKYNQARALQLILTIDQIFFFL